MCGIAGYIGSSKKPNISFALLTSLFEHSESRGIDAAGFWGVQKGETGKVLYHKEPLRSSVFTKKDIWKKLSQYNADLLMVHARGASSGVGVPSINKNNHPFISNCKNIGLIHNGRIPDYEYYTLKKKYEVNTTCDSEILLRIFEAGNQSANVEGIDSEIKDGDMIGRLKGLRDIWSYVIRGAMAVGIGEKLQGGNRRLWLFRNEYRTLWLADMRKTLGQIFFFSTPEIWQAAATSSNEISQYTKKAKLIEFPTEEIWVFNTSKNNPIVTDDSITKFDVQQGDFSFLEHEGDPIEIKKNDATSEIYTNLNAEEEVVGVKTYTKHQVITPSTVVKHKDKGSETLQFKSPRPYYDTNPIADEYWDEKPWPNAPSSYQQMIGYPKPWPNAPSSYQQIPTENIINMSVEALNLEFKKLKKLLEQVEISAENKMKEGSMSTSDYEDIMMSVRNTSTEFQATLRLMGNH